MLTLELWPTPEEELEKPKELEELRRSQLQGSLTKAFS
jgi:hypothetical protein